MHVDVPFAPSSVSAVRRTLVRGLRSRQVPESVVEDAALVVSELVANAVKHGRALPGEVLAVDWDVAGGRVRLSVADGGSGPRQGARAPRSVDVDAEGGRGLLLVAALAADWGVRRDAGAATVWVELPLPVSAAPERFALA